METPSYVQINQLLSPPASVVSHPKFQHDLSDLILARIVEKGNKVGTIENYKSNLL